MNYPQIRQSVKSAPTDMGSYCVSALPLMLVPLFWFLPALWKGNYWSLLLVGSIGAFGFFRQCIKMEKERLLLLLQSPILISSIVFSAATIATSMVSPEIVNLLLLFNLLILTSALLPEKPSDFIPSLGLMVVLSLGWSLCSLWYGLPSGFKEISGIELLTGIHKNHIGEYCAVGGLIGVSYLMTQKPSLREFLIILPIIGISFCGCLAVDSRATLLSIPVCAIVIAFTKLRKFKNSWRVIMIALISCAILLGGALMLSPKEKVEKLSKTEGEYASIAARPYYWDLSLKYLQTHPFSPIGYRNIVVLDDGTKIDNPCNFFLETWIQCGLLAACAYTTVIGAALFTAFRICSRPTRSRELSLVSVVCLSFVVLRFMCEVQDSCVVGLAEGMMFSSTLGALIFLKIGTHLNDRAILETAFDYSDT